MNGNNSFIAIARKDLKAAKGNLDLELWNYSARLCQQYVEKLFKSYIQINGEAIDKELLSSHNLVRLSKRISELSCAKFDSKDNSWFRTLKDYYYETNYPGDDYIELTEEEANNVYEWTISFADRYEKKLSPAETMSVSTDFPASDNFKCHDIRDADE